MGDPVRPGGTAMMEATALDQLFASLRGAGYAVIGPTVRDGAIVLDELTAASDLPFGWGRPARARGLPAPAPRRLGMDTGGLHRVFATFNVAAPGFAKARDEAAAGPPAARPPQESG